MPAVIIIDPTTPWVELPLPAATTASEYIPAGTRMAPTTAPQVLLRLDNSLPLLLIEFTAVTGGLIGIGFSGDRPIKSAPRVTSVFVEKVRLKADS